MKSRREVLTKSPFLLSTYVRTAPAISALKVIRRNEVSDQTNDGDNNEHPDIAAL
jgi:hypothetical protein